ncbi:MAG: pyridoxal phosphate-dependent aminotransferase [Planctomycetes bacterium]|nr:pyridoxal phosphate-dependent aminotransferase [Planctomycetota bacterium]
MPTQTRTVRISERAQSLKPSATFAVTARVRELRAQGRDVIGFGAGEPDFDTPSAIKDAAINALRAGQTGYQPVPGPPETREVIAEKLNRENGIACGPGDIVINAGAKHTVYLVLQALVDPGREVIIPTPGWVSYRPMAELCGGVVREVPGAIDNDFKITPRQLEEAITPETAVVILNSPSNPCGTMYTPEEINALADVVATHEHVAIISDEIYEKLIYGGVEHCSIGAHPGVAERVITINGLSKAYAMTGWRLGYLCAPGDGGVVARAVSRLQGQMNSHATAFCYPAIVEAITNGGEAVEAMRREFGVRAELIHGLLTEMPGVICPRPTGAFYAFPDIGAWFGRTTPGGATIECAKTFTEALLEEAHVAVVPGDDFGDSARRHVRFSFACSTELIIEGCRRTRAWLEEIA